MVYGIKGSTLHQVVSKIEFLSAWTNCQLWGSLHQDHGLGIDCEVVYIRVLSKVKKMPPWRKHGGRAIGVTPKGFRALQRKMQALEEQMCRGINLPIRNESEDKDEVEENVEVEAILNLEEERLFRAISKIGKRLKFEVPTFLENILT